MKYDSANLPEVSAARNCTRCTTLCGGSVHTELSDVARRMTSVLIMFSIVPYTEKVQKTWKLMSL